MEKQEDRIMDDLISRAEAIRRIEEGKRYQQDANDIAEMIDNMPSAQRTGKWIDEGQYGDYHPHHAWRCSECGEHVIEIDTPWFKYCPECGARMVEE